ncbi:MAG: CPBP family intramembrane metalloprotease [Bacilli bacterium]|nr:CPBP family intramembrane metalloprotease [Bacilli bacterium]
MKNATFNSYKSIGLIVLLIIYQYIPLFILYLLGINYNTFDKSSKMIYLLVTSIIFMFFLLYIYRGSLKKDFKNFIHKPLDIIEVAIKYWLIGIVIMIASNLVISLINHGGIAANEKAVRELLNKYPLFMLFQISVYAPFTEEVIFRKSIKDCFNNPIMYVLISGLIFGGMHVINADMNSFNDLLYIIPYSALGCVFALLYSKTDNIFSTIFSHSFHNTLTFLLLIVFRSL